MQRKLNELNVAVFRDCLAKRGIVPEPDASDPGPEATGQPGGTGVAEGLGDRADADGPAEARSNCSAESAEVEPAKSEEAAIGVEMQQQLEDMKNILIDHDNKSIKEEEWTQ